VEEIEEEEEMEEEEVEVEGDIVKIFPSFFISSCFPFSRLMETS